MIKSLEDLADLLKDHATAGARVFGLDGYDGCGKSSTAKELHKLCGWPVVHVDEFVPTECGSYVAHIDAAKVAKQVHESDTPTLVEGICLLAIAAKARFKLDVHVYIKRVSDAGDWADAGPCEYEGDPEAHITKLEAAECEAHLSRYVDPDNAAGEPEVGFSELRKELIRYHHDYRPANSADYVFCRTELPL